MRAAGSFRGERISVKLSRWSRKGRRARRGELPESNPVAANALEEMDRCLPSSSHDHRSTAIKIEGSHLRGTCACASLDVRGSCVSSSSFPTNSTVISCYFQLTNKSVFISVNYGARNKLISWFCFTMISVRLTHWKKNWIKLT